MRPTFRVPTSAWAADYIASKLTDRDGTTVATLARTWIGAPSAR